MLPAFSADSSVYFFIRLELFCVVKRSFVERLTLFAQFSSERGFYFAD